MNKKDKKRLEEKFNWFTKKEKPPAKEPADYPPMGEIIEKLGLEDKYYE